MSKKLYWVNRCQIESEGWKEVEQDNETWIVFEDLPLAVRKSELFELSIQIPYGDGLYQDTMECEHWEKHAPKIECSDGMVLIK